MDLSAKQVHLLCLPMGAFFDIDTNPPWYSPDDEIMQKNLEQPNQSCELWKRSTMNPAKRIDSIDPIAAPKWRIDGADKQGTIFHIVPLFMRHPTPRRVDVHIPSQDRHPVQLLSVLGSAWAFCIRDSRVAGLGISRHILRALEHWTDEVGEDEITKKWINAPFGSRIIVDSIRSTGKDMKCRFVYDYESERQMLSLRKLQAMWIFPSTVYPDSVDINQLILLNQLHDTVSLVSLPASLHREKVVFKTTISDTKYLYHELKLLLSMSENPHIMPKPLYLVTGKDRYGGDDKLMGFILPYFGNGNLADVISRRNQRGTLALRDQFRWAIQIAETLKVINNSAARFYSELKADNLLLDDNENVLFIDFEQMGNWITYSAPEIHYLEYCARLAQSELVPELLRSRYQKLLSAFVPDSEVQEVYDNPNDGYYVAWKSLRPEEQEPAEVYSLGKTLWCIFEGCADTRNSTLKAFKCDSGKEFPTFVQTPPKIRELISQCTQGNRDGEAERVETIRCGDKVVPRHQARATTKQAMYAAKVMWQTRIEEMEAFLEAKLRWRNGDASQNDQALLGFMKRPSLDEVIAVLKQEQAASYC